MAQLISLLRVKNLANNLYTWAIEDQQNGGTGVAHGDFIIHRHLRHDLSGYTNDQIESVYSSVFCKTFAKVHVSIQLRPHWFVDGIGSVSVRLNE
jgi:hypothetical protein